MVTVFPLPKTLFPNTGGVLVAADYSQLELRMIAHLSQDTKLISILNGGGDVFKTIAAQWKGAETHEITSEQRQQAKQVFVCRIRLTL